MKPHLNFITVMNSYVNSSGNFYIYSKMLKIYLLFSIQLLTICNLIYCFQCLIVFACLQFDAEYMKLPLCFKDF